MTAELSLTAVPGVPMVNPGHDVPALIMDALDRARLKPNSGDVLVIAQKIISKAEGRFVALDSIVPSSEAQRIAEKTAKDPRLVELILRESEEISRMGPGVLIVRHRLGFTSANAGIDRSNVAQLGDEETVLLLPSNPDEAAEQIRNRIRERLNIHVGIVIADSHGRPFRLGTVGVAIGAAGIPALWDRRGELDLYGYALQHTDVGVADEIAAAAGLLMGQGAEGTPVVLIRGLKLPPANGRAADLVRPRALDLYR
ncbi:MAG: coenzyme F420-0:L-glutamate ligase [Candidatus Promineifilaceae bacterium]|nr:coenzyme F420-0:L-glutamate ligase [Candidatus Promineifilaceae bacterium]